MADNSGETISALNYSTHAIEDLKQLQADMSFAYPESKRAMYEVIGLLRRSVKFILPNCGLLLDTDSFSQAHLDLLRLPFPVTAFEMPWKTDVFHENVGGFAQMKASKRIALCWEPVSTPPFLQSLGLHNALEHFPDGGVFVLPICWFDQHNFWTIGFGGAFVPYNNRLTKVDESDSTPLSLRSYEALKEAGLVGKKHMRFSGEPFVIQPELFREQVGSNIEDGFFAIANDSRDECQALIQACAVLNCENVAATEIAPSAKLNKARLAKKKEPFFSYKVLALAGEKPESSGHGEGTYSHASPKMHLRRGHIRRLEHKTVWVRAAIVGSSSNGIAQKDYRIQRQE